LILSPEAQILGVLPSATGFIFYWRFAISSGGFIFHAFSDS
ncbi:34037_t:CDS:2, partial [Racocetra persica]